MPTLAPPDPYLRIARIEAALFEKAAARGYEIVRSEKTQQPLSLLIHGQRISWTLYERSRKLKVPLTEKEIKKLYSFEKDKRWREVLEPSGWFVLVIGLNSIPGIRISESPTRRFEDCIDAFLDRFEKIAAYRRQCEEEDRCAQRRAAERERSKAVEWDRWDRFFDMAGEWSKAQRLRHFVDELEKRMPQRPDQARRLVKWLRWVRARIDYMDPVTQNFDCILAKLGLPKR